jgi:hypothetical protein
MRIAGQVLSGATLVALTMVVSSCLGQLGGVGRAACPQMAPNVDAFSANFSADGRANTKIRAFVQASKDIAGVAAQMEAQATDACLRMGRDLGLTPQQMAPQQGAGGKVKGACGAVSATIDGIFRQGVSVRVTATPPQCQVNAQASARCKASCDVQVDPGYVVANCQPGKLSGTCRGQCNGRCDGRCNGTCQGQCSQQDDQGRCVGQCNGTCSGSCDATCHAQCNGQWQAPKCEAWVTPPSVDAECDASCRAHANVHASCTPAQVQVQVSQNTQQAQRLAATLQANLPQLLHAQIALGERLIGDIEVVVRVGQQLPRIVGQAGVNALACVAAAGEASARASANIKVSIQASASVSGRVVAR